MHDISTLSTAVTHQLVAAMRSVLSADVTGPADAELATRDRGAVSLEQVLWFVAAGFMVAIIAGLLWSQIQTEADRPITPPEAP